MSSYDILLEKMRKKLLGEIIEDCTVVAVTAKGCVVERPDHHTAFVPIMSYGSVVPRVGDSMAIRIIGVKRTVGIDELTRPYSVLAERVTPTVPATPQSVPQKPRLVPGAPPTPPGAPKKLRPRRRRRQAKKTENKTEELPVVKLDFGDWGSILSYESETCSSDESDNDLRFEGDDPLAACFPTSTLSAAAKPFVPLSDRLRGFPDHSFVFPIGDVVCK